MTTPVESSRTAGATPVELPTAPEAGAPTSRGRLVLRRFLRNRQGMAGLVVLALLFALAYLSPLFSPWGYDELDYTAFLRPPSPQHWFGTTQIGGDVFAQPRREVLKGPNFTIFLMVFFVALC